MFFRRIDRYLAAELLGPFITALGFLFMLLFAMQLLKNIDTMMGTGVKVTDLFRIGAYLAPHFLIMAMPVSFLFAVMLAIGRLSEDREIVALAASGIPLWRLWTAPLALSLVVGGIGIGLGYGPDPNGLTSLKFHANELIKKNLAGDVKPNVFYTTLNGLTLYAQGVNGRTRRFSDVLLSDERDPTAPLVMLARSGTVEPHGGGDVLELALSDGEIHRSSPQGDGYAVITFEKSSMKIPVGRELEGKNKFGASKEELTPREMAERADALEREGNVREARRWRVAQHKRIAAPLATVVFALCGVPLSLARRNRSRAMSSLGSLGLYIAYYVVARGGDSLAESGRIAPMLAAHLPNLLFAGLSLFLVRGAMRAR